MYKRSTSLAALFLIYAAFPLFAKSDPIVRSTVRIVEGLTAPDWEARFLPPPPQKTTIEQPEAVAPDADAVPASPYTVKNRILPVQRPPLSRRKIAPVEKTIPASPDLTETERAEKTVVTPAPQSPKDTPPRTPGQTTKPLPAQAKSKIDKKDETNDDSADKRKKERRDTIREERKERNYRNRRIE